MHAWEDGVGFQWEVTNKWSQTEEVGELSRQSWWEPGVKKSLDATFRTQRLGVRPRGTAGNERK